MSEYISKHSEDVDEVLSRTPSWTMRWGISVFLSLFLLFLIISKFVRYPNVINATIIITSQNPPITIISQSQGKLAELFVADKQIVSENTLLAIIENPADYKEVLKLKDQLKDFNINNVLQIENDYHYQSLGQVQPSYSLFTKALNDYRTFVSINSYQKKIAAIKDQIKFHHFYYTRILQQNQTLGEELQLAQIKYKADTSLYLLEAIPLLELYDSKTALLQKKHALQGSNVALAQVDIQIGDLQKNIGDLEIEYQQEYAKVITDLDKSHENLLAEIAKWEQLYVLKAPISGAVSFFKYRAKNQSVSNGDEILVISPQNTGEIIGKINLPIEGSSRVLKGQKVIIKISNYPYEEYGTLEGEVRSISTIPKDSMYIVDIYFPHGLKSNYEKEFEFKQQMQGTSEIITENKSFLERIFNKLKIGSVK